MAFSLNRIQLIGRVGQDPELKYLASGVAVANSSLAVNRSYKKGDEWIEETDWFRLQAFDKTAENFAKFVTKGQQLYVDGEMRSRKYTKNGIEFTAWEINVRTFVPPPGTKAVEGSGATAASKESDELPW